MARSERITLRLSPEEKQRFEKEARKEDLQLSVYLRKKLGLSNLGEWGATFTPEDVQSPDFGAKLGPNPEVKVAPAHSASEIKRLAMQRHAHLPLGAAERKVREELG